MTWALNQPKKLFPAIELLRDPQGLAEIVFKRLRIAGSIKYDTKMLMINFITRLVGNQELLILPLYPYLQKYMGGQQRDVTALLAYTAFSNHRDRSVAIAGKAWTNFIREAYPRLLQGKHRGLRGTALYKSGAKPLRYGQKKVASGVEGADLLAEYEAKKALKEQVNYNKEDSSDDGESEDEWEEPMKGGNDNVEENFPTIAGGKWESNVEGSEGHENENEEAPTLVNLDVNKTERENETMFEVGNMSSEDRDKLKQDMSSSRIFSMKDFEKMKKLIARENRAKLDPRENARRKRAIARGEDVDELSDDNSDEDATVNIAGAVTPQDIMATARKKRQDKMMRLEKAIAGREQFEAKGREGGSTNIEKKRKKNFLMTKYSHENRSKGKGKGSLSKKAKGSKKTTESRSQEE